MKLKLIVTALAGAAVLGIAPSAYADPVLTLTDGTTTVTCIDNAVGGCDVNPLVGAVTYIGSVGSIFDVNISTGLGDARTPVSLMDLNSINTTSGSGTLTISFSETGFEKVGTFTTFWGGTAIGTASATGEAWVGVDDVLFQESCQIADLGPFSGGDFSASVSTACPSLVGPYSLTTRFILTTTGDAEFSGDMAITVPEPGSLALLGLGLAGLGLARRRKQ